MMQSKCDTRSYLLVDVNYNEKQKAKALAKSKGMTLQGWLGQLIKRELKKAALEQDAENLIRELGYATKEEVGNV